MNVLLAIDDSPYADAILEFALKHQWGERIQFTVLHVVEPLLVGSYMSFLPSAMLEEIHDKAQVNGTALVKSLADRLRQAFPSASVEERIVDGFPKEEIVSCASKLPADFIVLGSHGHRGMKRLLLGSVSQAVSSMAPCSVLIVRPKSQKAHTEASEMATAAQHID